MANAAALVELISKLTKGNFSKEELMLHCGISPYTVVKWMRLLKSKKLVCVADWRVGLVGQPAALWTWDPGGVDAPRPKPMTQKEYNERSRIRKQLRARERAQSSAPVSASGSFGDMSGTPG